MAFPIVETNVAYLLAVNLGLTRLDMEALTNW